MKQTIKLVALSLILFLPLIGCTGEGSIQTADSNPVYPSPATSPSSAVQPVSSSSNFEEALKQAEGYSTSVEIEWYTTGEKVTLNRDDPRYAEFIHLFDMSITGERISRTSKIVDDGEIPAISRTIPYAWGYILTFILKDGSKIWYNCSSDNIWFETENDIYRGSFSQEFRVFVEEIIKSNLPYDTLPGIAINPGPGQYLYHDSQLSAGTLLRSVSVRLAISQQEFYPLPYQSSSKVNKGDPILLVTGQVESQLGQDKYMTMYAKGYGADGKEVACVLDAGPIQGVISVFLPAKGFGGFILHMNAAPDVVRIEMMPSDQLYDIPPP